MELELMHDTREGWLGHAVGLMTRRLSDAGYSLPDKLKVGCGFAPGSRGGKKIMGVCISPKASAAGNTEVFVSPTTEDPVEVLGTLLHELGHACAGIEAGHGPVFKAFCAALGLEGKATEAAPGHSTRQWLKDEVLPMLGAYPHSSVDPSQRKKQGTRMIKLVCPETGYTVRTTKKWLAFGVPVSPVLKDGRGGHKMIAQEDDAGDE